MNYKITFLGTPIGTFKRDVYTIKADLDTEDPDEIILRAIYHGKNTEGTKFYNISYGSVDIKRAKS